MSQTPFITVPPPEEIERRIIACKAELKALARLKRMSRAAKIAADARQSRPTPPREKGGAALSASELLLVPDTAAGPIALLIPDTAAAALAGVSRAHWQRLRAAGKLPPSTNSGARCFGAGSKSKSGLLPVVPMRGPEAMKAAAGRRSARGVKDLGEATMQGA